MKNKYLIMTLACLIMVSCKKDGGDGRIQGHEYVDLGLSSGLKWATCNVGAKSPKEHGHYFAWGETSPKNEYAEENSLTYDVAMTDISGNALYDAATANWGDKWRMPTEDDCNELTEACDWIFGSFHGTNGYKVVGPNGNSIYLPAAGWRNCTNNGSLYSVDSCGNYWSSTSTHSIKADNLFIFSKGVAIISSERCQGLSVRLVMY
jgi:hypothetical protein